MDLLNSAVKRYQIAKKKYEESNEKNNRNILEPFFVKTAPRGPWGRFRGDIYVPRGPLNRNYDLNSKISNEFLVETINRFAFDFYKHISKHAIGKTSENAIFSPFSVYRLLHILYKNSDGEAESELGKILYLNNTSGFSIIKQDHSEGQFDTLINKNFEFENEVKSWGNYLMDKYRQNLQEISNLKLEEDMDNEDDTIFMDLKNSINFNQEWKENFEISTVISHFTKPSGKIDVIMMNIANKNDGLVGYGPLSKKVWDKRYKICEIPFKNENFVFNIMVSDNLVELEKYLDYAYFKHFLKSMSSQPIVKIQFPVVSYKNKIVLSEILHNDFDANKIFKANKNGLKIYDSFYKSDFIINCESVSVSHKTHFKLGHDKILNDAGIQENDTDLKEEDSEINVFKCDRPYIFFIRDKSTGLILYIGKVMVPYEFEEMGESCQYPENSKYPLLMKVRSNDI